MTFNENVRFTDYASRILLPNCFKSAINRKNNNDITIADMMPSSVVFDVVFFFLVKFSYWSKFHVNIINDSGVMTIFFYKGLIRNSEIGNTPSEFCPISGDWNELEIRNLARLSLVRCYWMLKNTRVAAFTE